MNNTFKHKEELRNCIDSYLHGKGINTRNNFKCLNQSAHKNGDRTPSMGLKNNICHCFACGVNWDIFNLIENDYGLHDFVNQYNKACELFGYDKETVSSYEPKTNNTKSKELAPAEDKNEDVAKEIESYKRAFAGSPAEEYLLKRGITSEIATRFNLGYASSLYMKGEGDKRGRNVKALIIPTSKYTYNARCLEPDAGKNIIRYQNKGHKTIFNADILSSTHEPVFIVEGEIDAITIIQCGFNAIGIGGASNLDNTIDAIKTSNYKGVLILALDNDNTGKDKENDLLQKLTQNNIPFTRADGLYLTCKDANETFNTFEDDFSKMLQICVNIAKQKEESLQYKDINQFLDAIQKEKYKPISTGLSFIDDLIGGGFVKNTMLYMLASPGTGKTTLCQQIAEQLAFNGHRVTYFNFESTRNMMIAKAISSKLATKSIYLSTTEILQSYKWTDTQRNYVLQAIEDYKISMHQNIIYNPEGVQPTIESLDKYLNQIGEDAKKQNEDAPYIVIDYIHLLRSESITDVREILKKAGEIIRNYIQKYDSFAIVISATNRDSNDGRLTQASGRDSSNIEYDADYMITLNYYDVDNKSVSIYDHKKYQQIKNEPLRRMILRTEKNRWGSDDKYENVYFFSKCNRFYAENDFLPEGIESKPFIEKDGAYGYNRKGDSFKAERILNVIKCAKNNGLSDVNGKISIDAIATYFKDEKGYSKKKIRELAYSKLYGFVIEGDNTLKDKDFCEQTSII